LQEYASDIFAPCATEYTITMNNVKNLNTKIILQGANNPVTPEAESYMYTEMGIHYLPDYLVNSGGVIACAEEYTGETKEHCLERILETVPRRVEQVFSKVKADPTLSPRRVSQKLAEYIIREAEGNGEPDWPPIAPP